jgi:hypothetical protein
VDEGQPQLGFDGRLYLVAFDHRSSDTRHEIADRYLRMVAAYVEYARRSQ